MTAAATPRPPRVFAVVPAAGRSARMGRPMLLLPWNRDGRGERTLIEHVLSRWQSIAGLTVVVTVRGDDAELAAVCRASGAEVVQPAFDPPDMKASIRAGLEHLRATHTPADDDVWLTAPADLPELSPTVVAELLQAYDRARPMIFRPQHADRFGHPTLFPWSTANELASIPPDRGLDFLFERLPFTSVAMGRECLADDVDTPADYRRLHDR